MRQRLFFILFMALGALSRGALAQGCCGIGSSLVAGGHPTLQRGTFLLQPGADYSSAENPTRYKAAGTLTIAYGITNQLAVSLKTNYAWLHSSVLQRDVVYNGTLLFPETTVVFNNHDIGDGTIGIQFSIIPLDVMHTQELKVGADVGIPWGPDQKIANGVELPKNMQTGSGAFSIGGFASYTKAFPAYYLAGAATAAGRLKFQNRRKERPGNEASLLVSAIAGPFWKTRESVSLNYKTSSATYDVNGTKIPSTEGGRFDVIPALEFTFTENIKATWQAELPVWREVYQKKFGNNLGARASMLLFIPAVRE
jgi:hypothetical protein